MLKVGQKGVSQSNHAHKMFRILKRRWCCGLMVNMREMEIRKPSSNCGLGSTWISLLLTVMDTIKGKIVLYICNLLFLGIWIKWKGKLSSLVLVGNQSKRSIILNSKSWRKKEETIIIVAMHRLQLLKKRRSWRAVIVYILKGHST